MLGVPVRELFVLVDLDSNQFGSRSGGHRDLDPFVCSLKLQLFEFALEVVFVFLQMLAHRVDHFFVEIDPVTKHDDRRELAADLANRGQLPLHRVVFRVVFLRHDKVRSQSSDDEHCASNRQPQGESEPLLPLSRIRI